MASRVLKFDTEAFRIKQLTGTASPVFVNSTREEARPIEEFRYIPESEQKSGSFAKGCLAGLGLEAAAAVVIYGLWEFWHFFR